MIAIVEVALDLEDEGEISGRQLENMTGQHVSRNGKYEERMLPMLWRIEF